MQNDNTEREQLEEKVKKELRLWIKDQHPSWLIYPYSVTHSTLSKGLTRQAYRFSPDIDVLAFYEVENKLIGFEAKAPSYKGRKWYDLLDETKKTIIGSLRYLPNEPYFKKLKKEGRILEKESKTEPDLGIIYKSMGEASFNLRYVDLSFIVLPDLKKFCPDYTHPRFLDLLLKDFLSLGLIEFEYSFPSSSDPGPEISEAGLRIAKFKEIYKAKTSSIWKDYNTYMGYGENNFVWEKGGPVGTIRDRLIDIVKKDNISLN